MPLIPSSIYVINTAGAGAVNVQDGGNTLTVDGSVAVTGTFWQTTQPVKGSGFAVQATLTVTNGAYTIGDVVGGLITFAGVVSANGQRCIINSINLSTVTPIAYELWFLNADLATPVADNGVFTFVAADQPKVLGVVPISTADYYSPMPAASWAQATLRGVGLEVKAGAATTSIYAYMKATAVTSPGTTTYYLTISGEMVD